MRKIIHIDMDCFYAAVEMRDNPRLREIPLAIGGKADQRGVVATCNYPAREFGIHSAMPTGQAIKLCPHLTVIPPRHSYYREISRGIRAIFENYTDLIEPLSLDEAYLDVTGTELLEGSATWMAAHIRRAIWERTELTASAGIAPNKFLAKVASDMNKPNGQFVIPPGKVADFVRDLPVKKIPGVGKVTQKKMKDLDIVTCGDLEELHQVELARHFGKFGHTLYERCRGRDRREVKTHRIRKSLSVERTFSRDIPRPEKGRPVVERLYQKLLERLEGSGVERPITTQVLKVKFSDFQMTTIQSPSSEASLATYLDLLPQAWKRGEGKGVRLIGLGVNFADPSHHQHPRQLSLIDDYLLAKNEEVQTDE